MTAGSRGYLIEIKQVSRETTMGTPRLEPIIRKETSYQPISSSSTSQKDKFPMARDKIALMARFRSAERGSPHWLKELGDVVMFDIAEACRRARRSNRAFVTVDGFRTRI